MLYKFYTATGDGPHGKYTGLIFPIAKVGTSSVKYYANYSDRLDGAWKGPYRGLYSYGDTTVDLRREVDLFYVGEQNLRDLLVCIFKDEK